MKRRVGRTNREVPWAIVTLGPEDRHVRHPNERSEIEIERTDLRTGRSDNETERSEIETERPDLRTGRSDNETERSDVRTGTSPTETGAVDNDSGTWIARAVP
ncbi:MAG: hypothetical protein R2909_22425, partial [Gemmatimonadales bacterium]